MEMTPCVIGVHKITGKFFVLQAPDTDDITKATKLDPECEAMLQMAFLFRSNMSEPEYRIEHGYRHHLPFPVVVATN